MNSKLTAVIPVMEFGLMSINCPKCTTRMIRMVDAKQSHIWFEHCGSCFGYFFDAGELRDLKEDTIFDLIKSWLTSERKP